MSSVAEAISLKNTPHVPGLPLIGSLLGMAQDPAQVFVDVYRKNRPVLPVPHLRKTTHGDARAQGEG